MIRKKFLEEIQKLIDEVNDSSSVIAEPLEKPPSPPPTPNPSPPLAPNPFPPTPYPSTSKKNRRGDDAGLYEKNENPHLGHRGRVKKAVDLDPDFLTFSDIEILEYVLFNFVTRVDTNELAHKLIDEFGSLSAVLSATVNELAAMPYFTENSARAIACISAVARRGEQSRIRGDGYMSNLPQVVRIFSPFFLARGKEQVYMATLTNNDRVISIDLIASGDTNFSIIDSKKVIEIACRHKAVKVVLAHNHPSGICEPSEQDKAFTSKVVVGLLSVNVLLVDHVIFTADDHYSFFNNHGFDQDFAFADKKYGTRYLEEVKRKRFTYFSGVFGMDNTGIEEIDKKTPSDTVSYSDLLPSIRRSS